MEIYKKNWFKYTIGFVVCLLVRLIPFRPPNIEPILATQMPFARVYGGFAGFFFGFLSIIVFDLLTSGLGMWSFITAVAYGLLGLWAVVYFKNKKIGMWSYAKFAVMGTILYDAITGLSVGPLLFHQSFYTALVGQIPFTLLHLVGNVAFALVLSPALYSFAIKKKKSNIVPFIKIFNPQKV